MKVQSALSLALAGTAAAAGAADNVNQVLTSIAQGLKELDSAVKAYTGGDAGSITQASNKILQTIESGASSISSGAELSLTDAVSITTNVQGLQTQLDTTLTDLKAIGQQLASAGQCSTMQSNLKSQASGAQKLQEAITSKAPAETKTIAQQLGGQIGASVADAQAAFEKTCAGAPSGGASSSSSGSSSSGSSGSSGSGHSTHGSGTSAGSSGSSSGSSGSSSGSAAKPARTSAVPKPATYQGGAATFSAPVLGAIALAILAL